MAARGEPFAAQHDDARVYAGEGAWQLDEVDVAEAAALHGGLVAPCDAEKVERVDVPKAHVAQGLFDLFGHEGGIAHLREGGDEYVALLGALYGALELLLIDGEIDHAFAPVICIFSRLAALLFRL